MRSPALRRPFRALCNAFAVAVIGVMAMGFGAIVVLWLAGVGQ